MSKLNKSFNYAHIKCKRIGRNAQYVNRIHTTHHADRNIRLNSTEQTVSFLSHGRAKIPEWPKANYAHLVHQNLLFVYRYIFLGPKLGKIG